MPRRSDTRAHAQGGGTRLILRSIGYVEKFFCQPDKTAVAGTQDVVLTLRSHGVCRIGVQVRTFTVKVEVGIQGIGSYRVEPCGAGVGLPHGSLRVVRGTRDNRSGKAPPLSPDHE